MLGRRILRIKAFKTVYSFAENRDMTLKEAAAQLNKSCEATRDLYLLMLSLPQAVTAEALSRIQAARGKFNPTEEERHPNLRFTQNSIARTLSEDSEFNSILKKKKFSWDQSDVLLRRLYENLKTRTYYKQYMEAPECTPHADAQLWVKFFEQELVDNPDLEPILEDMSIWWNDDLAYALTCVCRTVEDLAKGKQWSMPELYQSDMKKDASMDDDSAFVHRLVEKAIAGYDRYCESISQRTPKWDLNRICTTDLVLIACGLAESELYPQTSPKIIINEYVEISKFYSTPESRAFVNGILDKLINKKI